MSEPYNSLATESDKRLKKTTASEMRGDRSMEDRHITQNRVLTDDERIEEFRRALFKESLPDLPEIPGYHIMWHTTTNPRDSVHARIRMGYELVKAADVPGYDYISQKGGTFDGAISVNEMVALKLPLKLYQAYMAENHHHAPLRESEKLSATFFRMEEEAKQDRIRLSFEENRLQLKAKEPSFY